MNGRDLPDLREGDPLSASWLNGLRDLVVSALVHIFGAGFVGVVGPNGSAISVKSDPSCWARLDSLVSGSTYNATEQLPMVGGGWQDGRTLKGTEINGVADLVTTPPTKVWLQYNPSSDDYSFQMGHCA
jgi:hypothetical protein